MALAFRAPPLWAWPEPAAMAAGVHGTPLEAPAGALLSDVLMARCTGLQILGGPR